jgi:hypothetical protein
MSKQTIHAYEILVRKSDGKIVFGTSMNRWEDTIKIDLNEIGCGVELSSSEYGQVVGSFGHDN